MYIGLDCEFSFDADNEFVLVCAAVTEEDGSTRTWWMDELDSLKEYIEAHRADTWVAHNVETAEGYLFQSLGLRPTSFRWIDTLMLSRIANNECAKEHVRHDLATCLDRELGIRLDEAEKHANQRLCVWEQKCTWEEHLAKLEENRELLLRYCLSDTEHLVDLAKKLVSRTNYRCRNYLDKAEPLDAERRPLYYGFLASYMSEVSWEGIPLSRERVERLLRKAPEAMASMQMRFSEKYPGTFRLKGKKLTKDVAKCREYAEAVYGDNPPRTKSGAVSLASDFTKQHEDMGDFLDDYRHMDKRCRALASFSKKDREKNWLGMYLPKRGVIRPRLNLLGTTTGRCGSKPSTGYIYTMGKCFRGLIDPPEGFVVVELDYHSEEIGCQAYLSGDKTMAEMYEGPDYYTSIAHRMDPTITSKHDTRRKKYKRIALMSNYGAGAEHLADIAGVSVSEARTILKGLKQMFRTYWNFVRKTVDKSETAPLVFSDGFQIRNRGGKTTTLGNWPFQGVGALILRHLLVELYKARVHLIAPIHDAVAFLCKESEWKEKSELVAGLMRKVSKECLGTEVDVGDPEVTYHNYVNCHSELNTREDYEKLYKEVRRYDEKVVNKEGVSDAETFLHEYMMIMDVEQDGIQGDAEHLYVDEEFDLKGE